MPADFLSINDISTAEILTLLDWADAYRTHQDERKPLAGQSVALLFEKPSLRTKLSFDIGIHELGGHAVYLADEEIGLDVRESVEDMASVVERWVVAIVARVNKHTALQRMAARASVPVINGLSDVEHPCQAMADIQTIRSKLGHLDGVKTAFIGDANNIALSLALACTATGGQFAIAAPPTYGFDDAAIASIARRGAAPTLTNDPHEAVADAEVVGLVVGGNQFGVDEHQLVAVVLDRLVPLQGDEVRGVRAVDQCGGEDVPDEQ